jgi:hypothetical protein
MKGNAMSEQMADVIVKFVKSKEDYSERKFRYTATGDISGSIYVHKDSELVNDTGEIWLEIQSLDES